MSSKYSSSHNQSPAYILVPHLWLRGLPSVLFSGGIQWSDDGRDSGNDCVVAAGQGFLKTDILLLFGTVQLGTSLLATKSALCPPLGWHDGTSTVFGIGVVR